MRRIFYLNVEAPPSDPLSAVFRGERAMVAGAQSRQPQPSLTATGVEQIRRKADTTRVEGATDGPSFGPLRLAPQLLILQAMLRTASVACTIAALLAANASPARGQNTRVEPLAASTPVVTVPIPQAPRAPLVPAAQPLSVGQPLTIHEPRTGLLVAGTIVFGLVYGITLMGAIISWNGVDGPCSDCHSQSLLWSIPVAGPWAANFSAPPDERVPTLFVAAWSGLEAAGLAMIIAGDIGHDVTLSTPSATPAKVSVVPLVTPQAGMLSLRTSW
jgi:hypothetical protein